MTPNILISQSEAELAKLFSDDFIAHIDGNRAITLRAFYAEITEMLEIQEFGFTLESLNDALNDLQWLEDERIILYITETEKFIGKERDPAKMTAVLNILDATAEDWKWLEEDESINKKELIIIFEDSPRIRKLLDNEAINHKMLAELL